MFNRAPAALAALLLAAPAAAGDRSEPLMDLLGRLPTPLLDGREPGLLDLHFVDVAATASAVAGLPPSDEIELFGPWARIQSAVFTDSILSGVHGGWRRQVGFDAGDIEASLSLDAAPDTAVLLRLRPEAAEAVAPALLAGGYMEESRDGVPALARGEDFAIDTAAILESDPFGELMGKASRVALDGSLLVQANNWPRLVSLLGEGPKGHPDLAPLALALDDPAWGDAALLEASIWPDGPLLGRAGAGELPPWGTGLLADLAEGQDTLTLLLLTYPDRAQAEAALAAMDAAWSTRPLPGGRPLADATGAEPESRVLGDGPFVAALALRAPSETDAGGFVRNRAFLVLGVARLRGDLAFLAPG